jgi:protein-arginine kinase activator protein McsA
MRLDWKRVSLESIQHIGSAPNECHTNCNIANELTTASERLTPALKSHR